MLFSSLNTGSTDLRDTEVQQPNTTETLFLVMSCRAFSANSGQFDAGSTTTASSFLPSTPPLALISSIVISVTSFNTVSLIAIVPESECRTPTLIVSAANAGAPANTPAVASAAESASCLTKLLRCMIWPRVQWLKNCPPEQTRHVAVAGAALVRARLWLVASHIPCHEETWTLTYGFTSLFAERPQRPVDPDRASAANSSQQNGASECGTHRFGGTRIKFAFDGAAPLRGD